MEGSVEQSYRRLLEAASFAGRAHQGQLRKDGKTPYVSHPFRVCLVVRQVFGVEDPRVLTAALLHDTVEDTTRDYDDLSEAFGREIAGWVAALSKDKRLPEPERERAYGAQLAAAPWPVVVCKLADIFDNLMDSRTMPAEKRARVFENSRRYLGVIRENLPDEARRPSEIVARLLAEVEGS